MRGYFSESPVRKEFKNDKVNCINAADRASRTSFEEYLLDLTMGTGGLMIQ